MNSIVENYGPTVATLDDGFFVGVLTWYALKKPIRILSVIDGLVLDRLAYLQYQHLAYINWRDLYGIWRCYYNTVTYNY